LIQDLILNVKLWKVVAAVTFGLLILLLVGGNILALKLKNDSDRLKNYMIVAVFSFVFILALSIWPLAMHLIISFHERLGTSGAPIISFFFNNRVKIVLTMWGMQLVGGVIVLVFRPWR